MRKMGKVSYGRRRKSGLGTKILFLVLAILFCGSTGFLAYKTPDKMIELKESKQALSELEQSKTVQETALEEYTSKVEDLQKEIEAATASLEQAKKNNPELAGTGAGEEKYAYLTFDDGPSENTIKILDFLKANHIQATFFVLGKENQDAVYKRIVEEGHTLAVHSNTHDYSTIYLSVANFMDDITTLAHQLESITGVKPSIMRFPGGSNNTIGARYGGKNIMDQIIPAVTEAGYTYFDWNVDSSDATKNKQDKEIIVSSVLEGAKGKDEAVILMHDAAPKTTTMEALPEIVEGLRKQGFAFKAITSETPQVKFK